MLYRLPLEEVQVKSTIDDRFDPIHEQDPFDLYFECITACSLSNEGIECMTRCVEVFLMEGVDS